MLGNVFSILLYLTDSNGKHDFKALLQSHIANNGMIKLWYGVE